MNDKIEFSRGASRLIFNLDVKTGPIDPPKKKNAGLELDALAEYAGLTRTPLVRDAIQSTLESVRTSSSEQQSANARPTPGQVEKNRTNLKNSYGSTYPSPRTDIYSKLAIAGPAVLQEFLLHELRSAMLSTPAVPDLIKKGRELLTTSKGAYTDASKKNFDSELDEVIVAMSKRGERANEILAQAADMPVFFAAALGLQAGKHANTIQLMELVQIASLVPVLQIKHMVSCPRPVDVCAGIAPVVMTPSHGSWPSGHATQAFMFAQLLTNLCGLPRETGSFDPSKNTFTNPLYRLAYRIAENRVIAGVHYPMDGTAGFALGIQLASAVGVAAQDNDGTVEIEANTEDAGMESDSGKSPQIDLLFPLFWKSAKSEWK